MQLLANNSLENGDHQGLGWVDGTIEKLPTENLKMPHMGWNSLRVLNKNLKINPIETDYYFVHSYYAPITNSSIGITDYSESFASIIQKDNFYGTQFHPEKSSDQGSKLLRTFINL